MTSDDEADRVGTCWLHPDVQVRVWAIAGSGLFAARPLPAGTTVATLAGRLVGDEELTVDYATQTVTADFRMPCRRGAPACRQVITGKYWQLPQWRYRYQGHAIPAVAKCPFTGSDF